MWDRLPSLVAIDHRLGNNHSAPPTKLLVSFCLRLLLSSSRPVAQRRTAARAKMENGTKPRGLGYGHNISSAGTMALSTFLVPLDGFRIVRPERHPQRAKDRIDRRHGLEVVGALDVGKRHASAIILRYCRLFGEIPYFWRASLAPLCRHLHTIIDPLALAAQRLGASFSEKTGTMARKPKPELLSMGEVLARFRDRNDESREELGEAIGKGRGAIYAYERGITPMPYAVREQIAERYGIPRESFGLTVSAVDGTGTPDPAAALAVWVLDNIADESARELAMSVVKKKLALKI